MFKIIDFFKKNINIPMLLAAFFLTNTVLLINFKLKEGTAGGFYSNYYTQSNKTFLVVLIFLLFTGVLLFFRSVLKWKNTSIINVLLVSAWIYFFAVIRMMGSNIYAVIGMLAIFALILSFAVSKNAGLKGLKTNRLRVMLCLLFVFTAGFIGAVTVTRYLILTAPCFDFGIFTQMFEYMRTEGIPYTTCEREMLMSHFGVHMSPAFYLILPIYALFPSPITLQALQAIIVAAGIFPLYLICRQKKLPNTATLFVLIAYAFSPALSGGCMYDIHENMFLTTLLLWVFYFFEKEKWLGITIFSTLVFTVKEDAAIYIAVIALYMILQKKNVMKNASLLAYSIFSFFLSIALLEKFGNGIMLGSRFGIYTEDGFGGVIKTILKNPAFIIKESISESRVLYVMRMLLPVSFMPIISKKWSNLVLFIPFLLFNLMPTWVYQHDIGFQYNFGAIAIFFYLFVVNFADLKSLKMKKFVLIFAATASIFLFSTEIWGRIDIVNRYPEVADDIKLTHEAIDLVPIDASVAASTFYCPALYKSKVLYQHTNADTIETDYIVLDLRYAENMQFIQLYEEKGYEIVVLHEGLIVVLEKI